MHRSVLALWLSAVVSTACGNSGARDRFAGDEDASVDDANGLGDVSTEVILPDADPSLGGPCLDDQQCQKPDVPCAIYRCDLAVKRCRSAPDDTRCDDGLYCNGQERCDVRIGCIPGAVVACASDDACMIDRCIEETRQCESTPRDADGDGDPNAACTGKGNDCDDRDPTVSSLAREVCGNKRDDDCDGTVDEIDCVSPVHATCADALVITASGSYKVDLSGTTRTIGASCAPTSSFVRQIVVAIRVEGTEPRDVDILATANGGSLSLASGTVCGESATETGCVQQPPSSASVRLKMRNLAPGVYPLYVLGSGEPKVELKVSYLAPTPPSTNLTCATALPLVDAAKPQNVVSAELASGPKLATACNAAAGPVVYRVEVPAGGRDLRVRVTSGSANVRTYVGVRDEGCSALANELKCGSGAPADLFLRALPQGTYYVTASASALSDLTIDATLSPATTPPADEVCTGAPELARNTTTFVDTRGHVDDIAASCLSNPYFSPIAPDAAYELTLTEPSDVIISARASGSDQVGLGLSAPACVGNEYGCARGYPIRINKRALPAGDYRVVVESMLGTQAAVSMFVRPAATPGPVGADSCSDAVVTIPPEGGLFVGSTATMKPNFESSCDQAGQPPGGAADVVYRIDVAQKGRMIVDMFGSAYTTTVAVRKGALCPGTELEDACAAGYVIDNGYLDIPVEPGTHWIVVDGYTLASGSYRLDVRVVPPAPALP